MGVDEGEARDEACSRRHRYTSQANQLETDIENLLYEVLRIFLMGLICYAHISVLRYFMESVKIFVAAVRKFRDKRKSK